MAGFCQRCGAQQPATARFCQQCGAPLQGRPAATGPFPVAGAGSPSGTPSAQHHDTPALSGESTAAGSSGPFYQPAGSPGAVHRLPAFTVLGLTIGVFGVLILCSVVVLNHRPAAAPSLPVLPAATSSAVAGGSATGAATGTPVSYSTATSAAVQPPAPTASPRSVTGPAPTPVLPAATAAPEAASCSLTGPNVAATTTFCVALKSGWSVLSQDTVTLRLEDKVGTGNSGGLVIHSTRVISPTSVQSVQQTLVAAAEKTYPDFKSCGTPSQLTVDGVSQNTAVYCFTSTPQSGSAFAAFAIYWAATSADGRIIYVIELYAPISVSQVAADSAQLLQGLQWFLH